MMLQEEAIRRDISDSYTSIIMNPSVPSTPLRTFKGSVIKLLAIDVEADCVGELLTCVRLVKLYVEPDEEL